MRQTVICKGKEKDENENEFVIGRASSFISKRVIVCKALWGMNNCCTVFKLIIHFAAATNSRKNINGTVTVLEWFIKSIF